MKKLYIDNKGKSKDKTTNIFLLVICFAAVILTFVGVFVYNKFSADNPKNKIVSNTEVNENDNYEVIEETKEEDMVPQEASIKEQVEIVDNEDVDIFTIPCKGSIMYEFSPQIPIYSETLDDWRVHNGIDISCALGDSVVAVADGDIKDVYNDLRWGKTIVINHSNGIESVYSNLNENVYVQKGEKIKKGDVIALVGDTALFETVADTHLHFEMKENGLYVNPLNYLNLK